jgi:hypothetical protein
MSLCKRYNPVSKEELMALAGEKIWVDGPPTGHPAMVGH